MACIIWRMRAEGSSSSETMTEGLSARRVEMRTSLTASPRVALSFSRRGFSDSAFSGSASLFRSSLAAPLLTALRSVSPYLSTVEKTISSMSSSRMRTSMSFFL